MSWHDLLPVAVFLVTFVASVMSGMTGGGGGFIVTPFYIWIGLTPQQTVATLKFGGFGLSVGAISAFKEKMLDDKKFSLFVMALSGSVGLAATFLIINIDNKTLQRLMGGLILAMVPFMLIKARRLAANQPATWMKVLGVFVLVVVMFLQGVAGSGVGSLVTVIFILLFGKTALEANMLKRKTSLILNVVVVIGLLGSGLINYTYGLAGMAGGLTGGYVGSHIAIKKGDNFAQYALLLFMIVSGIWLVVTA
jgi:uncharacterized membrane protein YfcA